MPFSSIFIDPSTKPEKSLSPTNNTITFALDNQPDRLNIQLSNFDIFCSKQFVQIASGSKN
jgi:hypothetical protein